MSRKLIPESCMKIGENHFYFSSIFTLRVSRRLPSVRLRRIIKGLYMKACDACKIQVLLCCQTC